MTEEHGTKDYEAIFDVTMPGQSRQNTYKVNVRADSRVEALARAEAEWEKITSAYDVKIKEVSPVKVA